MTGIHSPIPIGACASDSDDPEGPCAGFGWALEQTKRAVGAGARYRPSLFFASIQVRVLTTTTDDDELVLAGELGLYG
jgi:hypothetical protein